ncbi:unnamed protein product [Ilex paraguariensis]|uniref:Uncharacterized protein n=1 Tax=Ilex paraguariensis TaxID=185542 RepID=A0ABC8UBM8_9AQUA
MRQEDAEELQKKIMSAKFDFNDFLSQTRTVARMGSMSRVIGERFLAWGRYENLVGGKEQPAVAAIPECDLGNTLEGPRRLDGRWHSLKQV